MESITVFFWAAGRKIARLEQQTEQKEWDIETATVAESLGFLAAAAKKVVYQKIFWKCESL